MNLAIVVGTRPQLIKLAVLAKALRKKEVPFFAIHTGQHYDKKLSDAFVQELDLSAAIACNLQVGSGSWVDQINRGVGRLVPLLQSNDVTHVLVIGDSNPAVVGAEAGSSLRLPVAHCEAGLRNFVSSYCEENNRRRIDRLSALHFCSTSKDRDHIREEIMRSDPIVTGDLLVDAFATFGHLRKTPAALAHEPKLNPIWLLTIHRAENVCDLNRLYSFIVSLLEKCSDKVVWPVHPKLHAFVPRLKRYLSEPLLKKLILCEPATYAEMNELKERASLVITDSVGLQVEAYLWKLPCVAIRDRIEHAELEETGATVVLPLSEATADNISSAIRRATSVDWATVPTDLLGMPGAACRMVNLITEYVDHAQTEEQRKAFCAQSKSVNGSQNFEHEVSSLGQRREFEFAAADIVTYPTRSTSRQR